ncbi:hybrid sensor histidine kinase/response regulator [Dyella sp. ASV21]|uniref:hybrid sensor histidine kinase/response regulator n=1 Tax=Dyella sp. ASV21 TaxID=2795114 RepID=UPI0018EB7BDA|nr:hybrid sensor histidine kinase/response regulator [Dyella sp. ASV21]
MIERYPSGQDAERPPVDDREGVEALRRHQRRSLWGGGGLLTALIVLMAAIGVVSAMKDFAAEQWDLFRIGQSSLSAELRQTDNNNVAIANISDALWTDQQERLRQDGEALLASFNANGRSLSVSAGGSKSLPWLIVERADATLPVSDISRYLGLTRQHSLFAAWTTLFIENPNTLAFAYDPTKSVFLISGISEESQLFGTLHANSRDEVMNRLLAIDAEQRASSTAISTHGGRTIYTLARNPLTGEMSLFTSVGLRSGQQEYLRRVFFQPLTKFSATLDRVAPAAFAIITRDGDTLFSTGAPLTPTRREQVASFIHDHAAQLAANGRMSWHEAGVSTVIGALPGTDWLLIHPYTTKDLWASESTHLLSIIGAAALGIAGLWLLLLRIDRRSVKPALAEAAMVYESEALNRTIIAASPVGMCLVDASAPSVIVKNKRMDDVIGDRDFAPPHAVFALLIERLRGAQGALDQEWPFSVRWPNGSLRQLKVVATPARYREHAAWLCTFHDVTAQLEFEHHLEQARQSAEEARLAAESASHAKSTFVASMSHEIRTPLHGILGHLELLENSPLDAGQHARLERIQQSATALLSIISDVLDFSKIEAGQMDVAPAPFELRQVVEAAALLFAPQAQRKGLSLYFHIAPTLDGAYVSDAHRISQILNNLLSNAVKFTESGRISVNVVRDDAAPDDRTWVRFEVLDSGVGLTPEQQRRLFKPFSQADQSIAQRYGGTGLGLVLCQQLAHLLGGHMDLRSTLGVGSVFRLHIPLTPVVHTRAAREEAPLHGLAVAVLASAPEWRTELGGYLSFKGAKVSLAARWAELPPDMPDDWVLLIVGGETLPVPILNEQRVGHLARVVRAKADGPLSPRYEGDEVQVSCYAGEALLEAVRGDVAKPTPTAVPVPAQQESGKVLLVEDHPVNRELLREQLESLGYTVDEAENGAIALDRWKPGVYRAVLTDLNMPETNGYELAHALRQQDRDIPILAITASALASEQLQCKEAGLSELLLKPLSRDQLDDALRRWIPQHGQASAPSESNGTPSAAPMLSDKVRNAFLQRAREDIAAMDASLANGNTGTLIDAVHSFKGALLMLRELDIAQRCSELEEELREDGLAGLEQELVALRDDLQHLVDRYERRATA